MLWSELCSPKIHLLNEFPTPNMTVFGDRTFNKIIKIKWSHEQSPNPTGLVTNFSLSLPNQPPPFLSPALPLSLSLSVALDREEAKRGHSKKQPPANQEESPHQKPTLTASWFWIPTELWENTFLHLNHPVCGILLGQPKKTNMASLKNLQLTSFSYGEILKTLIFFPLRSRTKSGNCFYHVYINILLNI